MTDAELDYELVPVEAATSESKPREPVVLVVDDDAGISTALRNLCALNNIRCIQAMSVKDGIEAVNDLEFLDVVLHGVLCDVRLPDGPGYQVIDFCRSRCPKLPAAVMTAFPDDELIRWLQETGVPLLMKPFSVRSVCEWLERARGYSAA
ncbi:MAG TPA: response regulator [Planctomycetota bacterium]|nr:response regulator [Planctomycetota bacterium]